MKNVGPQMQYDGSGMLLTFFSSGSNRPPQYIKLKQQNLIYHLLLKLGVGYKAEFDEQNALQLAGVFINNNFSEDEYKLGAEYGYNNQFFARLGYQFAPD
jgi:hypothetical protein